MPAFSFPVDRTVHRFEIARHFSRSPSTVGDLRSIEGHTDSITFNGSEMPKQSWRQRGPLITLAVIPSKKRVRTVPDLLTWVKVCYLVRLDGDSASGAGSSSLF